MVALGGCASVRTVSTEIYQDEEIQVSLVEMVDKTGERLSRGFSHPWVVDTATINALLGSIRYRQSLAFYHGKEKKAFPVPVRCALLKPLQQAFARADPDQAVEFSFQYRRSWAYLFSREYLTDGLLFIKDGELNCAFRNLGFNDAADVEGDMQLYTRDPTDKPFRTDWTLETGEGQRLVMGNRGGWLAPGVFSNWIALDLSRSWEATDDPVKEMEEDLTPGKPENRQAIERRLDFLEELHQEGVLTGSAYEEKRKDLLETLEALPPEE